MADEKKKLISIICPVYNEEAAVPLFYRRIISVIEGLKQKYDFEILFTNNASVDRTLERIRELNKENASVQVISLSKNFGYQASLSAGLHYAKGDAIIIIDVDCEDPPELIQKFIEEWEKGYEIVYGRRDIRPEPVIMQLARKAFYRITRLIADYDFILDMAEFSLFSASVRDAILENRSTYPFIRTEIGFVGFRKLGIPYARETRICGKTHYNFWRMTTFAIGGILSTSTFPLRLAVYSGIPLLILNLLVILLRGLHVLRGDLEMVFLMDCIYAITVLMFMSVYLARVYKDGVKRPIFIIDWRNSITHENQRRQTLAIGENPNLNGDER